MFRSAIARSDLAKEILRKSVRAKIIRNISVECIRRKQYHRIVPCGGYNNQILAKWMGPEETLIRFYSSNFPAHTKVALPALSPTMESGTIISWEKKEGDKLNEGDLLAEIETDKATMGFETPEEGYLAKILIPAGTKDVPIGKLVCIIVENEADVAAFKDFKDDSAAAAPAAAAPKPAAPAPAAAAPVAPSPPVPPPAAAPAPPEPAAAPGGRVYASPMAKRLAEQRNIRLQGKGSGLFGSITSSDLPAAGAAPSTKPTAAAAAASISVPPPPSSSAYVDIPVSGMRATIAKRLLQSKTTVPHYYLTIEVNVDKLLKCREQYNKKLEKQGVKLSVNDFIIKAVAMACKKVPEANSHWMDSNIRQFNNVDVSVAVSTDKGLITPIVFGADQRGITDISKTVKALAAKAREGKLQPQEYQGGTISVSNLGMFNVDNFCAIINPPQSCILAIGATTPRLIPDKNEEKGFRSANYLTVTLSCDHRVVDGAVGAKWLQALRSHLEDPVSMII
ncbi:unnamed protein product [Callosobruchus maculatus]|uniref:Acetyltransferase component of pyruvate dehydrogenase complex n=1 Tax=Callosobruchus maculatus TaxID=64391 RepID=A0A653CCR4_CALMS|nr:unnamed protein product [Callosobruchus maculatus]